MSVLRVWHAAKWAIHDGDAQEGERITLQIELGNDHALTLNIDGDGNHVTVWTGNGEHNFTPTTTDPGELLISFRQWLARGDDCR